MLIQAAASLAVPAESNITLIIHVVTVAAAGVATTISTYVSYRLLRFRGEVRRDMETVVRDNCAGRAAFDAHVTADDLFQRNLMSDIVDKRDNYRKQHEAHFEHEARTDIHQPGMSSDLIQEKFEHVKTQIENVGSGLENMTKSVERLTLAVNEKRSRQRTGDN